MDAAAGASSSSSGRVNQTHVLVVDDCRINRYLVQSVFKKCSCKVTTAENGAKALEFLGISDEEMSSGNENVIFYKQRPGKQILVDYSGVFDEEQSSAGNENAPKVNLISSDYEMPGMNGYELLKKIKLSPSMKDVPVVIVSSSDDSTVKQRCMEAGALEFIVKPLKVSDVENLMRMIR